MKAVQLLAMLLTLVCSAYLPLVSKAQSDSVLLFSYFKGNGEDGLHLARSKDGLIWTALNNDSAILKPMVGNEKLMRDPCIIQGNDGFFHMVWTASWKDKGIGYAKSRDLVNWSQQQFIPVMAFEPAALNCWAPEIVFDDKNAYFMIYWATTIPGRFPATDSAGDEKYNHRMYYTTTRDFKTFTQAKMLYDQGFSVIDATIVKDAGKYLMFLKDETRKPPQKNIRVAHAASLTGPYTSPSSPITGQYWAEGPTAIRSNNLWTVYFDKYTLHSMGAVRSADAKHWEDISGLIRFPTGTRHGTVFSVSKAQFDTLEQALRR